MGGLSFELGEGFPGLSGKRLGLGSSLGLVGKYPGFGFGEFHWFGSEVPGFGTGVPRLVGNGFRLIGKFPGWQGGFPFGLGKNFPFGGDFPALNPIIQPGYAKIKGHVSEMANSWFTKKGGIHCLLRKKHERFQRRSGKSWAGSVNVQPVPVNARWYGEVLSIAHEVLLVTHATLPTAIFQFPMAVFAVLGAILEFLGKIR